MVNNALVYQGITKLMVFAEPAISILSMMVMIAIATLDSMEMEEKNAINAIVHVENA